MPCNHARFYFGYKIIRVYGQDATEPCHDEDNTAFNSKCPPAHSGSGTSRDYEKSMLIGKFEDS
jgi:hypothetical protein